MIVRDDKYILELNLHIRKKFLTWYTSSLDYIV